MMKKIWLMAAGMASLAALADANPWQISAGPAWRSRVKGSVSGTTQSGYDKPDPSTKTSFGAGDVEVVQDPDYPNDPTMTKYAYTRTQSTTVTGGSDTDSPLGFKANLSRDLFEIGDFSLGLAATFAAYWKMEAEISGLTLRRKDLYCFSGGPIPPDPVTPPFLPEPIPVSETLPSEAVGVAARLRSDLYQIGLGPQATWRAFDWLEAYGRIQALCNIASLDFDAGAASASDTKCLFGVGGTVGLAAFLTENIGLFAEVGYEWIDKADMGLGRTDAEIDFSSLVVSAGVVFRF